MGIKNLQLLSTKISNLKLFKIPISDLSVKYWGSRLERKDCGSIIDKLPIYFDRFPIQDNC